MCCDPLLVRYEAPLNFEPNGGDGQLNVDGAGVHDRNAHDRDADEPTGAEEEEVCTVEGLTQQQLPVLRELLDNCSSVGDAVQKANKFGMCEEAACGARVLRHVDDMISYSCFRPRRLEVGRRRSREPTHRSSSRPISPSHALCQVSHAEVHGRLHASDCSHSTRGRARRGPIRTSDRRWQQLYGHGESWCRCLVLLTPLGVVPRSHHSRLSLPSSSLPCSFAGLYSGEFIQSCAYVRACSAR
jgi:hypothetical protein